MKKKNVITGLLATSLVMTALVGCSSKTADTKDTGSKAQGGDLGWIAKGQLDERLTAGIFGAKVGSTSTIVAIPGDGIYLYKVLAEETRTPGGRQLGKLKSSAFSNWYDLKKTASVITRDASFTGNAG